MSQVAKLPLRQVDNVQKLLMNDQARGQLAAVAAKHMSPERLMRVTANAIRTTPKLQECEPLSFLGALMQCAALGLEPNTVLGHAYLIPFDKSTKINGSWVKVPQVQLIIGYKGLIDLARRSGHITSISANIHYSDDELWEYEEGTEAKLRHVPGPQDGKPLHAYAIAKFVEGGHAYVVLPWAQVLKIRDGSQGWQSAVKFGKKEGSPWFSHETAMAKKTAIRALAKFLPLSVEFREAVAVDQDGGAKVDYARFALNPEEGATIEGEYVEGGEADTPDDDILKDDQGQDAPKDTAPEDKNDAKPAPAKADHPEVDPKHIKAAQDIEADLNDSAPIEATLNFHAEALDAMKADAPEFHAELMATVAAFGEE
jgi:recombination protein RecT